MDFNNDELVNISKEIDSDTSIDELLNDKTKDELVELRDEILKGSKELEDAAEINMRF